MNKLWAVVTAAVNSVIGVLTGSSSGTFKLPHAPQTHKKELSVEVVRPDDLLVLTLDFYNTHLTTAGAGPVQLEQSGPGDGFIVAHFQPQSFAEQAFYETTPGLSDADDPLLGPPVASRIAGPSQLIFRVDPSLLPFEFALEKILAALAQSETVVQRWVQPPPPIPPIGATAKFGGSQSHFTAIEAPYRLILSPNLESNWEHALAPVLANKRVELWHTRLSPNSKASAVWSPDYTGANLPSEPAPPFPFRMSLTGRNRHQIVGSTAERFMEGRHPVDVEQLMLSSQGAWLNVHGQWDPDLTQLGLVEWRHIMTSGRDQYARVVKAGYLFPFGHRAVLITITERKLGFGGAGQVEGKPVAYLRQRKLIIVREPTKAYQHRDIPFRTATIKNLVTPNLDLPKNSEIFKLNEDAFWPRVGLNDFLFHIVATDWENDREIDFHVPLAFMMKSFADAEGQKAPGNLIDQIINNFNGSPVTVAGVNTPGVTETDLRRSRAMGGQKIAFAPFAVHGDTTLETMTMIFGACRSKNTAPPVPPFLPAMAKANVDVPEVRQISGSTAPSTIQFRGDYLRTPGNSVIGNLGHVFATVLAPPQVKFSSDQTGGMVAPDFGISGLSRAAGPVGGFANRFSNGSFKPVDIFKDVKLLGGIELSGIIKSVKNLVPSDPSIPKLKTIRTFVDGKEVFQTSYRWEVDQGGLIDQTVAPGTPEPPDPPEPGEPPPTPLGPFVKGMFMPDPGARFFIESIVNTPLDGSAPTTTVSGELNNFSVTMLPALELVRLHFTSVKFSAGLNGKTDFAVIFKKFEFLGFLTLVNKLMDVIPMDGFNDPPFLDLVLPPESPGVRVGFTQGIPTVGIGVFSLENIAFSASFFLPFLEGPANLRLAFCERHQPFTLTVSLLGGGGFFAIDIGFTGVRSIEAALEFGASVALNLGVASGSATVMGGVYFKAGEKNSFDLSAYVRAAGSLEVLGIITVSVELYVALSYASKTSLEHAGKLWGQASISVKIKIAFFSKSVSISIEREFAGSDPKFFETISPAVWSEYCATFADCPV
ncbi:MAG TPA: hypothetical protein VHE60_06810 [Pyrinomonadaceae bacterium]|nr:hypothetical protein [Pyrinomonadaceae bacterium]